MVAVTRSGYISDILEGWHEELGHDDYVEPKPRQRPPLIERFLHRGTRSRRINLSWIRLHGSAWSNGMVSSDVIVANRITFSADIQPGAITLNQRARLVIRAIWYGWFHFELRLPWFGKRGGLR